MKRIQLLLFLVAVNSLVFAQAIKIEPEEWVPCEEIKIIIDISQGDCERLLSYDGDLYLWTWSPADPTFGNGQWSSSDERLKLTHEGGTLYSYIMVPTEFYGISADEVYANGFSMLVKGKDGGGGGDCSAAGGEFKTSDFTLSVAPPSITAKAFTVPQAFFHDDYVTFIYDNSLESKESMRNEEGNIEFFMYISAFIDGVEYVVEQIGEVGTNENLRLNAASPQEFRITFIPSELFGLEANEVLESISMTVVKKNYVDSDDRIDETIEVIIGCEANFGSCL